MRKKVKEKVELLIKVVLMILTNFTLVCGQSKNYDFLFLRNKKVFCNIRPRSVVNNYLRHITSVSILKCCVKCPTNRASVITKDTVCHLNFKI